MALVLDPLTLGDTLSAIILIIAAVINWKVFHMYYKSAVKPKGRYFLTLGLLLFAILNQGVAVILVYSGLVTIELTNTNQAAYIVFVLLKSVGPIVIFYASLLMYQEAKRLIVV
ncbi:MAG: hypothetical protein HYS81_00860 [Candidatus Aenigmatarchaeota archaeon]|nr:MAG: hypothetical protein HYS81_00860 [Candidatus Aenigmarchaeota archaeon]